MRASGHQNQRVEVRRGNVTACTRCRSRKQKCDQTLPACSNCRKAAAECISYDTITGRVAPRSYLQNLEDRVAYLEKKLESHGISYSDVPSEQSTSSPNLAVESPLPRGLSPQQVLSSPNIEELLGRAAYVSISAGTLPRYLGAGSGLPLLRLVLMEIGLDADRMTSVASAAGEAHGWAQTFYPTPMEQFPPMEHARSLIDTYFQHNDFFMPILDREDFMVELESVYATTYDGTIPEGEHSKYFKCFAVLAVGILLLIKTNTSVPQVISDKLMASAMRIMTEHASAILTNDLDHLEVLLLLTQYISLHPQSTGAWHMTGLVVRLATDLGLHEEPSCSVDVDPSELDRRRRLFWSAYSLEVNISTVLGRPISIPSEVITTNDPSVDRVSSSSAQPQLGPSRKSVALWMIKTRRFEAEIHTILSRQTPHVFDYQTWRGDMARRLQELYDSRPVPSSPLVPAGIFEGAISSLMVRLYAPSKWLPEPSAGDQSILASNAIRCIETYRDSFRQGTLRFFWRTIPGLFRAGTALLYCMLQFPSLNADFSPSLLQSAVNTCSSVLWGMVERYPPGKANRDLFDEMAKKILDRGNDSITGFHPGPSPQHNSVGNILTDMDRIGYGYSASPVPVSSMTLMGSPLDIIQRAHFTVDDLKALDSL